MNQVASYPILTAAFSPGTGATAVAFQTGTPPPVISEGLTACFSTAFTPSGTTVTMYYSEPAMVFTGAAARINAAFGATFAAIRHISVWARRKPGTTGSIAAQTVKLQGWNGSAYEEVARINVSAAAAGAEPVSDYLSLPKHAGDTRYYFGSAHPFKFIVDSADPDLELACDAYGLIA